VWHRLSLDGNLQQTSAKGHQWISSKFCNYTHNMFQVSYWTYEIFLILCLILSRIHYMFVFQNERLPIVIFNNILLAHVRSEFDSPTPHCSCDCCCCCCRRRRYCYYYIIIIVYCTKRSPRISRVHSEHIQWICVQYERLSLSMFWVYFGSDPRIYSLILNHCIRHADPSGRAF